MHDNVALCDERSFLKGAVYSVLRTNVIGCGLARVVFRMLVIEVSYEVVFAKGSNRSITRRGVLLRMFFTELDGAISVHLPSRNERRRIFARNRPVSGPLSDSDFVRDDNVFSFPSCFVSFSNRREFTIAATIECVLNLG